MCAIQSSSAVRNVANDRPDNGQAIGAQARKLTDNDVVQLAGVKMGFFAS